MNMIIVCPARAIREARYTAEELLNRTASSQNSTSRVVSRAR